jgi:hypothetical protein
MKRILIFLFLFPAIATASFYAVVYILTGAELDSVSGPALLYAAFAGPGLVLALVDWLIAKTPIPAVIGTTLFVYGALVLYLAWDGNAAATNVTSLAKLSGETSAELPAIAIFLVATSFDAELTGPGRDGFRCAYPSCALPRTKPAALIISLTHNLPYPT